MPTDVRNKEVKTDDVKLFISKRLFESLPTLIQNWLAVRLGVRRRWFPFLKEIDAVTFNTLEAHFSCSHPTGVPEMSMNQEKTHSSPARSTISFKNWIFYDIAQNYWYLEQFNGVPVMPPRTIPHSLVPSVACWFTLSALSPLYTFLTIIKLKS